MIAPASVPLTVPCATPSAPVGLDGWVSVLPAPLVASDTTAPGTGLPWSSRTVIVNVELPDPAAMESGVADTLDRFGLGTGPPPPPPPPDCALATAEKVTNPASGVTALAALAPASCPSVHCAEA